ncbi:MAG: hypothetical protein L0L60_08175, partial [Tetragenococcus halophilus]|nr:hypothetical protein [Tetragenococcus halophilus]
CLTEAILILSGSEFLLSPPPSTKQHKPFILLGIILKVLKVSNLQRHNNAPFSRSHTIQLNTKNKYKQNTVV